MFALSNASSFEAAKLALEPHLKEAAQVLALVYSSGDEEGITRVGLVISIRTICYDLG